MLVTWLFCVLFSAPGELQCLSDLINMSDSRADKKEWFSAGGTALFWNVSTERSAFTFAWEPGSYKIFIFYTGGMKAGAI